MEDKNDLAFYWNIFGAFAIIVVKLQKHKAINNWLGFLGVISFLLSIVILEISLTLIIIKITHGDIYVQEAQDKYNTYMALFEEEKDVKEVVVQNQLYNDIIKYNTLIRKNKHYSESLWTNWYYPKKWREMKEIEIPTK